ncbi:MAG: TolC family protein [Deltaproteobacteria bacterium]|nr:TolC family protein [Deltaproteobacteria bacterium]
MAITLEQAIETAVAKHPDLAAYPFDLQANEARTVQAALPPNPELEVEVVNIGALALGTAPAESSAGVSQALELGGKRSARVERVRTERRVLEADFQRLRLDLIAAVRRGFAELQAAQERLALAREAHDLASRLSVVVSEKVKAGATSPIEETRARVALSTAEADEAEAARALEVARLALGAAIGDPAPDFAGAAGTLSDDLSLPDWPGVAEALATTPDLTRWDGERRQREASLALEEASAVPDVTLRAAYAYDREGPPYNLFTLGVSVPLPLRNRNQGSIAEARANLAKVAAERRAAEVRLRNELAQRYATLEASARQVRLLQEGALAGAREAYQTVDEGYRFGKFGYLDVLDANSAFVQAKLKYLEALASLNLARIDVDRLLGLPELPAGASRKPE